MPQQTTTRPAVFITNPEFRRSAFGDHHPLSIRRHATVLDLCESLGWLDEDEVRICGMANMSELEAFHDKAYLDAFREAVEAGQVSKEHRERYNLGTMENPLFPGLWERAAATVGGAILGARLALQGHIAYHPAGGTHHGRPDRASGFCYFNDPVFAIRTFLNAGVARVLYVDFDAHHGDGVQDAFANDARVMTISIHEKGRWPNTGPAEDRGGGNARNLPVPAGFNDEELDYLISEALLPMAHTFAPEAVVITTGADALKGDPLSGLALSNGALWRAVEATVAEAPHAVVLGGGGYNPWTVARSWAGLWGHLSGKEIPEMLPAPATEKLTTLECDLIDEDEVDPLWLTTLRDKPNVGTLRAEVAELPALFL